MMLYTFVHQQQMGWVFNQRQVDLLFLKLQQKSDPKKNPSELRKSAASSDVARNGTVFAFKPCAWTFERRSHTGDRHRPPPPAGYWWDFQSCACCPCCYWIGTGALRRLQQRRKSTAGRPEVSLGWLPGAVRLGSCIHTGCRGCARKRHYMNPAARDDGSQWTCGWRKGRFLGRMRSQRQSLLLPASHTGAGRWEKMPAGLHKSPSYHHRHHLHCYCWWQARHECYPAYLLLLKRKFSGVGRNLNAAQRSHCSLLFEDGCRSHRPVPRIPVGRPCCSGRRQDTQTDPGCTAGFPCSPHWRCWVQDEKWEESRRVIGGVLRLTEMACQCWR